MCFCPILHSHMMGHTVCPLTLLLAQETCSPSSVGMVTSLTLDNRKAYVYIPVLQNCILSWQMVPILLAWTSYPWSTSSTPDQISLRHIAGICNFWWRLSGFDCQLTFLFHYSPSPLNTRGMCYPEAGTALFSDCAELSKSRTFRNGTLPYPTLAYYSPFISCPTPGSLLISTCLEAPV